MPHRHPFDSALTLYLVVGRKTNLSDNCVGHHDNWDIRYYDQGQFPSVVKGQRHTYDKAHNQPEEMAHFFRNTFTDFVDVSVGCVRACVLCGNWGNLIL